MGNVVSCRPLSSRVRYGLLAAGTATILALGSAPARAAEPAPAAATELVRHALHDAFVAFSGPPKTEEQRERIAEAVVRRYADLSLISGEILGSTWSQATGEQQRKFSSMLVDYGLSVWARPVTRSGAASEEKKVRFTGTTPDGQAQIVHSVLDPSGSSIRIDWTIGAEPDGRLVIINVTAENVSFITTMRDDFTSYLHHHDGGLDGLMVAMRSKIDKNVASAE